mmetsp:Transcript_11471/g.12588  ORF Transcript_11471/g.12588 Transcript_11471/m.12588 type:complete len:212 (+) Transcript_11471:177-812(+)
MACIKKRVCRRRRCSKSDSRQSELDFTMFPKELQWLIYNSCKELYIKWPLICKATACRSRFNCSLQKHGAWVCWNKKCQKYKLQHFRNGKPEGKYIRWHQNSCIEVICWYKNGLLHGEYKAWYQNGKPAEHCLYKYGKVDGTYKRWFDNGQLNLACQFKKGKCNNQKKEKCSKEKQCQAETRVLNELTKSLEFFTCEDLQELVRGDCANRL